MNNFATVTDLGYTCKTPCPAGQFCGSDGACHSYSCNDWYQFATSNWTDYDPDLPLTCTDRSQFESEFEGLTSPAIVYGCTGFSGIFPSPPKAVYQAFTRKCIRDDGDKLEKFVCYEMADKTNFQPFVVDAKDATLNPCSGNGTLDGPEFIYQAMSIRQNVPHGYTTFWNTGNATADFDRERGLETMLSNLTILEATPTQSPTQPPTFNSNACAMQNPGVATMVGLLSFLCLFL
ncbi:hypothetical protein ACHAWF_016216 [Thalassiosira exigua]